VPRSPHAAVRARPGAFAPVGAWLAIRGRFEPLPWSWRSRSCSGSVTGQAVWKRLTKFWGKLFLINFAMGVATGIVQEFQFGMNWSEYSRFVGDVFGAPLAIEALLAFFLESTFLGLWIFGWDKLPKKAHLASIWLVAIGSNISALWILIANSFMQQPMGYALRNGRAEMESFAALITNPHVFVQFPHVIAGAMATAAFFVLDISAWHLLRAKDEETKDAFRRSFHFGAAYAFVATVAEGRSPRRRRPAPRRRAHRAPRPRRLEASARLPATHSAPARLWRGPVFRRQRGDMAQAVAHPALEIGVPLQALDRDEQEALHRPAREVHPAGVLLSHEVFVRLRPHADHQLVLDDADAHVTADHEGDAAEHLLLGDVVTLLEHAANPLRQPLVVGHKLSLVS
jgi:hypothetical protein